MVDFHVRTGATAISWPHHKGESHNLTMAERKSLAEVAIRTVAKRIPVRSMSVRSRSRYLRPRPPRAGQGRRRHHRHHAVFLRYPPRAIYEHFERLGTTCELPLDRLQLARLPRGVEFSADLTQRLLERLPNLIAMKEASFNSERFLEILRVALPMRPDFAMIAGVEFLLPSVCLGGKGSYSSAGAICPNLVNRLFDSCEKRTMGRGPHPPVQALPAVEPVSATSIPRR